MSAEMYGYVEEKLFEAGALDVFKTPIVMKKGRPAVKLSILAKSDEIDLVETIIFKETTAIGTRKYPVVKHKLDRVYETVETDLGPVTVKFAYHKGTLVNWKLEYEMCRKIAVQTGMPLKEVYQILETEIINRKGLK